MLWRTKLYWWLCISVIYMQAHEGPYLVYVALYTRRWGCGTSVASFFPEVTQILGTKSPFLDSCPQWTLWKLKKPFENTIYSTVSVLEYGRKYWLNKLYSLTVLDWRCLIKEAKLMWFVACEASWSPMICFYGRPFEFGRAVLSLLFYSPLWHTVSFGFVFACCIKAEKLNILEAYALSKSVLNNSFPNKWTWSEWYSDALFSE